MATRIAPLARADVQQITSAQVVPDLRAAVKELVENALDAEVRFKEHGLESIEVLDNGSGIAKENYATLALKHHTSKLSSFDDLQTVTTLGFRGEALSSLCAVAHVQVLTATQSEVPMGTVLEFDGHGALVSSDKKVARQRGTTVTVTELLKQYPVRRKELEKHVKREYNKAHAMLQAYALITPGVRWASSVSFASGKRTTQLALRSASGERYLQANMTALFGAKTTSQLLPMDLAILLEGVPMRLVGLVSKPAIGSGRSSGDRQYFYLNRRPWDASKLAQVFNQVYKTYNIGQYPCVVANLEVATDQYDVNVSPDKRTILVHQEAPLLEAIRDELDAFFAPTRGVLQVHGPGVGDTRDEVLVREKKDGRGASEEASEVKPDEQEADEQEADEQEADEQELSVPVEEPPAPAETDAASERETRATPSQRTNVMRSTPPPSTAEKRTATPDQRTVKVAKAGPSISTRDASWSPLRQPSKDTPQGTDMRAQFRRAVEKFAMVNADLPQESSSEEDELESDVPSSQSRRRAPVSQDLEYAESEADEREAMDEDIDGTEASTAGKEVREAQEADETVEGQDTLDEAAVDAPALGEDEASNAPDALDQDEAANAHDTLDDEHEAAVQAAEAQNEVDTLDDPRLPDLATDTLPARPSRDTPNDPLFLGDAEDTLDVPAAPSPIPAPASPRPPPAPSSTLCIDMDVLKAHLSDHSSSSSTPPAPSSLLDGAGFDERDIHRASHALERVIQKTDFGDMHIVGQFNLGFIIARRRLPGPGNTAMDDLFIIDQHAADEKFNYERLQRDTRIHSQRLLAPQPLELAPSDELVAAEHADWLKVNGFEISVDEAKAPGKRVHLLSKPVSKDTVFDVHDFEELLFQLREAPSHARIRCSKVRDMLASRACRKSIMVGSALDMRQMRAVVKHMGEIEQPWNCPHGRPTMRHLASLAPSAPSAHPVRWARLP